MIGLRGNDVGRLRKRAVVDRHVTVTKEYLSLGGDNLLDDLLDMRAQFGVLGHKEITGGIMSDIRQFDALASHFFNEQRVRNLNQHARAVAHERIGPDRTAMGQVLQHEQAVLDDLMGLLAFHMGDKADTAGIVLIARVVKALLFREPGRAGARHRRCRVLRSLGL